MFSLTLTCFFIASAPTLAATPEKVTLQLKWLHQFQFAGYYAAKAKGFYEKAGFDVSIVERDLSVTPVDSVLNGEADFAISDSSLVLQRMKGKPVVILGAIFQHSPLILITHSNKALNGPFGLIGKRVMYLKGIDDAVLLGMFHKLGISTEDFTHVPHTFDDFALLKNEIDAMSAYSTDQPYVYAQKNIDISIIDPMSYGVDFYGDMLFAHEAAIKKDPERAYRFLQASIKGWEYALEHPNEIIHLIKAKYKSRKSFDNLDFEAAQTEKVILPNFVDIGHTSISRLHRIGNIYKELKMVASDSNFDGITLQEHLTADSETPLWMKVVLVSSILLLLLAFALTLLARRLKKEIRKRSIQLDKANTEKLRHIETLDQYIISSNTDLNGVITQVSKAFCNCSGYTKTELIGQPHSIVRHPDTDKKTFESLWATINEGKPWSGTSKNKAKNGDEYWLEYNIEPVIDNTGKRIGYVSIGQDISDKKRIELLSITDKLTGLYNRAYLDEVITAEIKRFNRYEEVFSILICDIDNFKAVNDTFGHIAGDKVLVSIAKILQENIRDVDTAGRWGGEEFLIVCPSSSVEDAAIVANKLREAIANYLFENIGYLSASFGVASINQQQSAEKLIHAADTALYEAKHNGRNCVEISQS